jgi:hypothetical protein
MTTLTERETVIILAALRAAQREKEPLNTRIPELFAGWGARVSNDEIDALCEKINLTAEEP